MVRKIKVWDITTRIFHWSLVVCFFTSYVSGESESLLHIYISYVIIGLLAFRLVWGFIGPRFVRFSNFLHGIKSGLSYLRSILLGHPQYYLGHNPLGGWMIMLLLVFLAMTSWTGLELYAQEGKGPLASVDIHLLQTAQANGKEREQGEDAEDARQSRENEQGNKQWLEDLHEALASFTLLLVFVHIGGVFITGWLHRENLVRAMWTGYKTPPEGFTED